MASLKYGDRAADLGGRCYTIILAGARMSMALPDGHDEVVFMDNDELVKMEPCPRCGVPVEPYAPCGSDQCYAPEEES
jgi:hypothetical protein